MGDIRCIIFGHLTRMTVWRLRATWNSNLPIIERARLFSDELSGLADIGSVIQEVGANSAERRFGFEEEQGSFELDYEDAVPF